MNQVFSNPLIHGFWDVRNQLKDHIYSRSVQTFERGNILRDRIESVADVENRKHHIRSILLQSIGGLPHSTVALQAKIMGKLPGRGFWIEKILFQARKNVYVTANLYIPKNISRPRGAVLFLCGHHDRAKHDPEYQTACQTLVNTGLIVLALDPLGQGERVGYLDQGAKKKGIGCGSFEHDYVGAQSVLLGDNIARYFAHDAMRGVDYLLTRNEVDPLRIGVTGNSGGVTQASLMMMLDDRIAAASPATFITSRMSHLWTGIAQDAEQIWHGFSAADCDHEDILIAMCPKPVRVLAVKSDFFPIEGTRSTVERCQRFWTLYGKNAHLDLVEDTGLHQFTKALAESAAAFFARHLLDGERKAGPKPRLFDPERLWCTESGQVKQDFPGARTVFDENKDRLVEVTRRKPKPKSPIHWLKKAIFYSRIPCEKNPRFFAPIITRKMKLQPAFWWSQPGLFNYGIMCRAPASKGQLPVCLALWEGGTTQAARHLKAIHALQKKGFAVFVLDPSGVGALETDPRGLPPTLGFYGATHRLSDDLSWLGDSLAALRIYDVIRAIDVLSEWGGIKSTPVAIYAHGSYGVYAQLAQAVDKRIHSIQLSKCPTSFAQIVQARLYDSRSIKEIIVPGILRTGDIQDFQSRAAAAKTQTSHLTRIPASDTLPALPQ